VTVDRGALTRPAGVTGSSRAEAGRLTAARRRRQLIGVALETFASHGFAATTMEEIASSAGVTKPLLYQHFASKRALYLELVEDVTTRLIAALRAAATASPTRRGQVEAGFEAYFRFTVENPSAVRMLFDAPHDEELASGLRSFEDAIAGFLVPFFPVEIDEAHRRTLAAAVVGMTEGVTRDWLRRRPADRLRAASSLPEAALLAGRIADFAWGGFRSLGAAGE